VRQREVQAGGDRQRGLVHAADHRFQVRRARDGVDARRGRQAADLHQLDVDHVGQAAGRDAKGVAQRQQALVGHHRQVRGRADLAERFGPADRRGLLDQFEPRVARRLDEMQRGGRAVALVGVEAQLDRRADRLAHAVHAGDVVLDVAPALQFQRQEAARDEIDGALDGFFFRQDADRHRGGDAVAVTAQQHPQRQAGDPPQQVVQRHVDRRQRRRLAGQRLFQRIQHMQRAQGVEAEHALAHDAVDRRHHGLRVLAGDAEIRPGATEPDRTRVGQQAQEDVLRAIERLVGDRVGFGQPHLVRPGLEAGDAQLSISAGGSRRDSVP